MKDNRAVVFVIDDDASMRGALDNLLSSVGLDVRVFPSPQEFLRTDRPDAPGCILLDLRLPGMSGLVVQQEFATTGIALPVIFISARTDTGAKVRALKLGGDDYLTKPFDALELGALWERSRGREPLEPDGRQTQALTRSSWNRPTTQCFSAPHRTAPHLR